MSFQERTRAIFDEHVALTNRRADRFFAGLLAVEWAAAIAAALWISPRTWSGLSSETHPHVHVAVFLGTAIAGLPIALCILRPGEPMTRHCVAIAQMLFGGLFVQFTGGRIETHFHYFGSLAFLAFYRDWRVLVTASAVVAGDHFLRGMFWPESVYGISRSDPWRWVEHASWVGFEDACLILSIRRSRLEMLQLAERRAQEEEDDRRRLAHAEAKLVESEQRFRLFMDNGPALAFIKDADGRYVYANAVFLESMRTVLGMKRDDVVGLTDAEMLPPDAAREIQARDREVIQSGTRSEVVQQIAGPDGALHHFDVFKFPLVDAEGRKLVAGIALDVTERRELEEQFLHTQKLEAVGRLAGGVAHDFNNLLMVINGYSDEIIASLPADAPARRALASIRGAGERAQTLTQQLLAFSRKQVVEPEVVDLGERVAKLDDMLRRLIGEDIELYMSRSRAPSCVRADPGQLDQVVVNLVVNASDAISSGGRIEVSTSLRDAAAAGAEAPGGGEWVVLTVRDTGCGMDERTRGLIFEPFFSTKGPGKGTGLGLATAHGIVTQWGGFIRVTSAVGAGSTFEVHLPRVEAKPPEPPAPAPLYPRPAGVGRVLLVEDSTAVRDLAVSMLTSAGYTVIDACDGADALHVFEVREGDVDLLITDSIMPRLSGPDLVRKVRALRPELPVILMSGYTEKGDAARALVGSDTAFLQKPFTAEQLLSKVREALREKSPSA